jgi:hypothetical protein
MSLVELSEFTTRRIETLGPMLILAAATYLPVPKLQELGVAAVIYSSYDYGFGGDRSGYAVLYGNRNWTPKEHKKV